MPRPWERDGDRDDDVDPPSEGTEAAQILPFPTLDLPWPDGEVTDRWWTVVDDDALSDTDADAGACADLGFDDAGPLVGLVPAPPPWPEPTPCQVPHRQIRPVHRRRSRHSFEPQDLSDADLDRLLRGSSPADGHRPAVPPVWPTWLKLALAASVVLAVVGIVGLATAAGDTPDTITTRGQRHDPPPSTAPPTPTATPPAPVDPRATLPPINPSGATPLPDRPTDTPTTANRPVEWSG